MKIHIKKMRADDHFPKLLFFLRIDLVYLYCLSKLVMYVETIENKNLLFILVCVTLKSKQCKTLKSNLKRHGIYVNDMLMYYKKFVIYGKP